MINDKYPVKVVHAERITFTWFKIAIFGMMAYNILEMINRVLFIFFATDEWGVTVFTDEFFNAWKIADSVFYGAMFVLIAIQVIIWRGNDIGMENKKKARNAFYSLLVSAIFLGLYETLVILQEDLPYSHRSDLAVPFLLMIMAHFYGLYLIKQLFEIFGKYYDVQTGKSIFYVLFALNPAIRYLSSFIILFMVPILTIDPYVFIAYSEVIMTYISAVIGVGFFIILWLDSRKLKNAQLIKGLEPKPTRDLAPVSDKRIKYIEEGDEIIGVPIKNESSIFCPSCGIIIYDNAKKCSKCGTKIE